MLYGSTRRKSARWMCNAGGVLYRRVLDLKHERRQIASYSSFHHFKRPLAVLQLFARLREGQLGSARYARTTDKVRSSTLYQSSIFARFIWSNQQVPTALLFV